MLIVHVLVHVKKESIEDFKKASLKNAENSIKEPGIVRFDIIQQKDDPSRFILAEIYRTEDDPLKHKQTSHYAEWRKTVEPMMAESRKSKKYVNIFPDEDKWELA
ncbi:MAG: antibiotic biosynthesis monooxygenase [Candidatus Humimicrobiaceae bacterium]